MYGVRCKLGKKAIRRNRGGLFVDRLCPELFFYIARFVRPGNLLAVNELCFGRGDCHVYSR